LALAKSVGVTHASSASAKSTYPRILTKPRLKYARSTCGEDLYLINQSYHEWVQFDEFLPLHYERIQTGEHFVKLVKCSKRGNDVYSWRVKKRIPDIDSSADLVYDDEVSSQFVFVTFEFNSHEIDCFGSWVEAPEDLNRAMANIRKAYPGVKMVMRSFEAHSSGYIHAHVLLMFPEKMSMKREWSYHRNCWIYYVPDELRAHLKESWGEGYTDVMGMPTARGGCRYTMKYIMKSCSTDGVEGGKADYTLAMNWYLGRRSFHVTKDVMGIVRRDERLHNSNQIQKDLEGGSHPLYILLSVGRVSKLKKDPGRWFLEVSEKKFEELQDHSYDQDDRLYKLGRAY
jgi:hypothetical protein